MKTIFTFLLLAAFSFAVSAQLTLPVDFELAEEDTVWNQFANAGDAPENMVLAANPDDAGDNQTENCLKFTVLENADPWIGAWSDAYGAMDITDENSTGYMMVYKDVVTNTAFKMEMGQDPAQIEVKVPNTVTEEWELITYDLSAGIGNTYTRLVVFPDFPDTREAGSICYVDLIGFSNPTVSIKQVNGEFFSVYPNPASEVITVQYPGMRNITISNIVGQTVKTKVSTSQYIERVQVADLKPGVYFVTLDTPEGLVTSKFLKR